MLTVLPNTKNKVNKHLKKKNISKFKNCTVNFSFAIITWLYYVSFDFLLYKIICITYFFADKKEWVEILVKISPLKYKIISGISYVYVVLKNCWIYKHLLEKANRIKKWEKCICGIFRSIYSQNLENWNYTQYKIANMIFYVFWAIITNLWVLSFYENLWQPCWNTIVM